MKRLLATAALSALVALPLTAQAAPVAYKLDPAHTAVVFIVDHLGFAKAMGRFNTFAGELSFDKDAADKSSLSVTIDTTSVDTNHAKRDEHLKSPDFFNAKEFPKMTFKSTKIETTGDKTGKLHGDLTLLGVTKPVVLDVTFNKDGVSPASKQETVGFSARGTIKRSDFGMKYGVPNIGDDIQIIIESEAVKA
ncbi:polyisoprenoid-binding protein (plasmid) [Azospirillum baldaniorum]|uniref:Polyprenyl-pyrophosphate binding protein n=1 Tax=Azospirillum baldaniorum TaxID=1064539 RepID=A0A9P1JXR8_9PROT|nr:YceI family protein [Azospirillum baldaniorum]AWJ93673.1 polyisoprenoid-binding protein [Azospirillum baldaniorum]TWA82226.1 polyisoprenoid-binding protein YceI [Azospirillum brasilense]CCD01746.1 polyprenyl-pyrophosphate binding protein [Azospirillum baldaniorum]